MAAKPLRNRAFMGRALQEVLLLVDTSRAYGRGLVHGVALYNREHGGWTITFKPHGLDEPPPPWLRESRADGILARVGNEKMADAILKMRIPAIDLRGVVTGTGLPSVGVDNHRVARLAVEHFLERGFKRYGFCGLPPGVHPYMDELGEEFVGQHACRRTSVLVPEQVAVLSADNDPYLCELAVPPLSSVDENPSRIGYEAAALLDRWMDGKPPAEQRRLIPPRGIVTRQSTDLSAIEDPRVVWVLRFIRENACKGLRPSDVVAEVPLSRVALANRFKRTIGHTIGQEIHRVQIGLVEELLSQTEATHPRAVRSPLHSLAPLPMPEKPRGPTFFAAFPGMIRRTEGRELLCPSLLRTHRRQRHSPRSKLPRPFPSAWMAACITERTSPGITCPRAIPCVPQR